MSMDGCLANMMWIERAKRQWMYENQKAPTDTPTEAELLEHLNKVTPKWCGRKFRPVTDSRGVPYCYPTDNQFIIGSAGTRVQCPAEEAHGRSRDRFSQSMKFHYGLE